MSPGLMRLIFGGFAVLMASVVINTLLLQPDVTPVLANVAPPSQPPANAPAPAQPTPVATKTTPPLPRIITAAVAPTAPRPDAEREPTATARAPSPEVVRVARLTTDSASPTRMPRLPEIEGDPDIILRVQKELLGRGYGPVVANGIIGPLTRAAIMAYEFDTTLPLTGEASELLLKRMREGATAPRVPNAEARKIRSPEAEQVVRTVQHSLTSLGYEPGRISGRMSDETERAIRAFETANGMQSTGRVSAELFSTLARSMGARSAKMTP